ncbi:MGH1-like glycoside hydrolase domain-containing protein [Elizabethkingia anophelis]|uniref:Acyl-coenzyme A synthetase/AMP-(Fatty) acid ligase n=1 Tax=Elizabethkingia anophelis NUHP1 TaxID=1338011 RepID=A0A077EIB4_9FLAO|nr:glucosidase [Elizabethkingia anophelis]AIL47381.1 Acyl-coenzyme A synthetase/AMP-(fatty) acid ligase [Elizabethkingia anophelis NUHP1]MBE9394712.1 glucosidase [Elizabethkingia anophelis]MBE9407133.1 glucosidase [Elizabethkingia anophelis]BBQ06830.1 glucosidase [Elizabethkingia anophelis]
MTQEYNRLKNPDWKIWGPYVSNRQWGTVREDYSANGDAWNYTGHDSAEALTFRWGEEGIAGISDQDQTLCFALGFWNHRDKMIKERFFGLSNSQGNHGEDIKELFYYLESSPTHSYMKMLYKYPQNAFPYEDLITTNRNRGKAEPEYEIIDTGIFDNNEYFDITIEYAKADIHDILVKITVENKGPKDAPLSIFPTLWFRNTWCWGYDNYKPELSVDFNGIKVDHQEILIKKLFTEIPCESMFCNNESNTERLYQWNDSEPFAKDGINQYILTNNAATINPEKKGTKAALKIETSLLPGEKKSWRFRLGTEQENPFADFDQIFGDRVTENEDYYNQLQKDVTDEDKRRVQRQAFAGLMWNKQFYHYNVSKWLKGDPNEIHPPESRYYIRNEDWQTLNNKDIISMPDKWEYPWYATWDLAFHCVGLSLVDSYFAKDQLLLLTREWYMHPNGQLPAYEWNFSDVNPPVHAWATFRVFKIDEKKHGKPDLYFLESVFQKLLLNFTWWVNRKDMNGNNIFGGGFLGLDNIGAFDRNTVFPNGEHLEQADGTSWMAMFSLNMLRISLELALYNPVYEDMATKFFEHFLYIAEAMNSLGDDKQGLWNEEDGFFYDVLQLSDGTSFDLRLRSIVGLIPMFAVEVIEHHYLEKLPNFAKRMDWVLSHKPELAALVSHFDVEGQGRKHLLSILRGHRLKKILERMVDPEEFLSDYGIRALSKVYEKEPFQLHAGGNDYTVKYLPAESDSDMFGGNSNWRGPIWFPINFLIIESLQRFHFYFGDDYKIEYPKGSHEMHHLNEIAEDVSKRLCKIFLRDENGRRAFNGDYEKLQNDPEFRDYILFYEYFHGDTGRGVGASHQTGWTALVAKLLQPRA